MPAFGNAIRIVLDTSVFRHGFRFFRITPEMPVFIGILELRLSILSLDNQHAQ